MIRGPTLLYGTPKSRLGLPLCCHFYSQGVVCIGSKNQFVDLFIINAKHLHPSGFWSNQSLLKWSDLLLLLFFSHPDGAVEIGHRTTATGTISTPDKIKNLIRSKCRMDVALKALKHKGIPTKSQKKKRMLRFFSYGILPFSFTHKHQICNFKVSTTMNLGVFLLSPCIDVLNETQSKCINFFWFSFGSNGSIVGRCWGTWHSAQWPPRKAEIQRLIPIPPPFPLSMTSYIHYKQSPWCWLMSNKL